jgi:hypothetical protein
MSTVKVMKEVVHPGHPKDNWHLALQRAAITYSDGRAVKAYRFVCREGLGKPEPVVRKVGGTTRRVSNQVLLPGVL